jgi:putative glutamine amidotransferase
VRAIVAAGGLPLIMPMVTDPALARELAGRIDALVVTGGPAVEVGLIGRLPPDLDRADPVRAEADRLLVTAFLEKEAPILGICYGMQLLNALDGGTIYADVEHQIDGALVHSAVRGAREHPISPMPDSILANVLGKEPFSVNSRHIQAVAETGPSYRVSGRAPDGVIEAIERPDGRVLGVQFHPERMEEMRPLFTYFVHAAADHASSAGTLRRSGRLKEQSREDAHAD